MNTATRIVALAGAAMLTASANADHLTSFVANLSGENEVPSADTPAGGVLSGVFDSDTNTFTFSWTISDLLGTPGAPGAHIHNGLPTENGPIVFAMTMDAWSPTGEAVWSDMSVADVDALFAGELYANFHTDLFQGGEVRGQLMVVPAPSGVAALGGLGLVALRRRRR